MNIYTVISLVVLLGYVVSLLIATQSIKNITLKADVSRHWSGRINIKELKKFIQETNDSLLASQAKRATFMLWLGKFIVFIGLFLFISLMIIKAL